MQQYKRRCSERQQVNSRNNYSDGHMFLVFKNAKNAKNAFKKKKHGEKRVGRRVFCAIVGKQQCASKPAKIDLFFPNT